MSSASFSLLRECRKGVFIVHIDVDHGDMGVIAHSVTPAVASSVASTITSVCATATATGRTIESGSNLEEDLVLFLFLSAELVALGLCITCWRMEVRKGERKLPCQ